MFRQCILVLLLVCIAGSSASAQQIKAVGQGASASVGAKQGSDKQTNDAQTSATLAISETLKRIAATQEAPATCAKPGDENTRECRDLKAQEDMAFWSRLMFWATAASGAISLFATILIFQTLKQSRKATFAALRAAVAGRQSIQVSRESAAKQLRAYVSARFSSLHTFYPGREIRYAVKNHGQTPAGKFRHFLKFEIWPYPLPPGWDRGDINVPENSSIALSPGEERLINFQSKETISRADIDRILNEGDVRIYAVGEIWYEDAFGEVRRTWFCTVCSPNQSMKMISEGGKVEEGIEFVEAERWNGAS